MARHSRLEVAPAAKEEIGRGGGEPRLAELGHAARLERRRLLAAVVVRVAGDAQIDLAGEGLGHEAGDGAAVDHQSEQRAPDRDAGDEGAGAVDGIDDPGEAAGRRLVLELFADDAVIGEALGEQCADGALGLAVGVGHRVEAGCELVVDGKLGAEAGQGVLGRDGRRIQQRLAHKIGVEAEECGQSYGLVPRCESFVQQN